MGKLVFVFILFIGIGCSDEVDTKGMVNGTEQKGNHSLTVDNIKKTKIKDKEMKLMDSSDSSLVELIEVSGCGLAKKGTRKVSCSTIEDFDQLRQLQDLISLDVSDQPLEAKDLIALGKLTTLEELNVSGTEIENIEFVASMPRLRRLSIGGDKVKDISPLAKLAMLENLEMDETYVGSIRDLANCKQIKELVLSGSKMVSVLGIEDIAGLEKLFLDETQVENIDGIENLSNLKVLVISGTKISNLKPLKNLKQLEYLAIDDTLVSDTGIISDLAGLETLTLDEKQAQDLYNLKKLDNLKNLTIIVDYKNKELIKRIKKNAEMLKKALPGLEVSITGRNP